MSSAEKEMGRSIASSVNTWRRSRRDFYQHYVGDVERDFERTVLHDITDDAEFIEVTTTSLSAEGLLECDLMIEATI